MASNRQLGGMLMVEGQVSAFFLNSCLLALAGFYIIIWHRIVCFVLRLHMVIVINRSRYSFFLPLSCGRGLAGVLSVA